MRAAVAVVLLLAVTLTGCGRLRDGVPAPSPTQSAVATEDVSELLEAANEALEQSGTDLRTGDEAAEQE